jgi:hypothetical protein
VPESSRGLCKKLFKVSSNDVKMFLILFIFLNGLYFLDDPRFYHSSPIQTILTYPTGHHCKNIPNSK